MLKKFPVVVWCGKVIIVSALYLSLRDKESFRDWEIERAWQYHNVNSPDMLLLWSLLTGKCLATPSSNDQWLEHFPKQSLSCNLFSGWLSISQAPEIEPFYTLWVQEKFIRVPIFETNIFSRTPGLNTICIIFFILKGA